MKTAAYAETAHSSVLGLSGPPITSWVRDVGVVYPPKTVSAVPQEHGALQYPVADTAEARAVPPRFDHTVRPLTAEEDQATDRTTLASRSSAACTQITRKRRRDR